MKRSFHSLAALLLLFSAFSLTAQETGPWQVSEPFNSGMLAVADIHTLYYEESGNPDGIPVIVLHGGPGVGSTPGLRSFFDPDVYRIIIYDQRGAGQSTPVASVVDNTTAHLVEDINTLREHLGIRQPAVLWGLSWGTTLALAYAQHYPDNVAGLILVSTFTAADWEIDHIYHGGAGRFFPEDYQWVLDLAPRPWEKSIPAQYYNMISGPDEDLAMEAVKRIAGFEIIMVRTGTTRQQAVQVAATPRIFPFAKISTWYMMHRCFLEKDQLIRNAHIIKDIPTWFAVGRTDPVTTPKAAWDIYIQLNKARFEVADGSSHNDPGVFEKAREGAVWMAKQLSE